MVNWNYLETFVILSETLNFSEAARTLSTSQPVVSRHIRLLEHELGYPLFLRSTKQVALTKEGFELKLSLSPLVEELKRLLSEKKEAPKLLSGSLRVGSITEGGLMLLMPKIEKFLSQHPKLQIHVSFGSSASIIENVLKGKFDLGFVHEVPQQKSIQTVKVYNERPVLITDKKSAKDWRQRKVYQLIGYRENDTYLTDFLDLNFSKTERKKVLFGSSVSSHAAMIDLVARQRLMAVLPQSSIQQARAEGRIEVALEGKGSHGLYLLVHENGLLDKRKAALLEFLTKEFEPER